MLNALPQLDIDPYDPGVLENPAAYHEALRELGPAVHLPRYDVVALGRAVEVEQVFRDWQTFCSSRGVGLSDFATEAPWRPPSIVLEVDPPAHDRTRRVLARALSPRAVAAAAEAMAVSARRIIETACAAGTIEAVSAIAEAYPLEAFGDAVGIAAGDRRTLLRYGDMVFNALGPDNARRRAALEGGAEVVEWINAQCERDALSPNGIGATIHEAAAQGEIESNEANLLVRSLLSAGIDTTVATLAHALRCFAAYPEQWQKLRREPALIPAAIDEVLRFASPVHTFCRTTVCEAAVGSATVPADTKLLCVIAAANRDPRRWPEPDRFDITRARKPHVSFGSGIHVCVGQHIAKQELGILLEIMLEKVAELKPNGPPVIRTGNAVNTVARLPLLIVPG